MMATARQMAIDRQEWKVLASLHGIVGAGAVAGGLALLTGHSGLSEQHLDGSLFASYVLPGLALLVLIGGSSLLAAAGVWRRAGNALDLSLNASVMLAIWFAVQFSQVGVISWLQPFMVSLVVAQSALAATLWSHRHH